MRQTFHGPSKSNTVSQDFQMTLYFMESKRKRNRIEFSPYKLNLLERWPIVSLSERVILHASVASVSSIKPPVIVGGTLFTTMTMMMTMMTTRLYMTVDDSKLEIDTYRWNVHFNHPLDRIDCQQPRQRKHLLINKKKSSATTSQFSTSKKIWLKKSYCIGHSN
jgi:hypothetical protein